VSGALFVRPCTRYREGFKSNLKHNLIPALWVPGQNKPGTRRLAVRHTSARAVRGAPHPAQEARPSGQGRRHHSRWNRRAPPTQGSGRSLPRKTALAGANAALRGRESIGRATRRRQGDLATEHPRDCARYVKRTPVSNQRANRRGTVQESHVSLAA
jgi:hypothetical protein